VRCCRPIRRLIVGALCTLSFGAPVAAAGQTAGSVLLTAHQPDGETTTVVALDSGEPPRSWSAEVRGTGVAALSGLPAGLYRIHVTLSGGPMILPIDIMVGAAEVISLAVDAGSGSLRVLDRSRLASGTYFDARQLHDLPAGSGVSSVLDTAAPFVIVDGLDTGGLHLGSIPRTSGHGASATHTTIAIGDIESRAASAGVNPVGLSQALDDVQALSVTTGMASAEVPGAGARITFMPRWPPADRAATGDVSWTAPGMVSTNGLAGIPSIARARSWAGGGLQFGERVRPGIGLFLWGSSAAMTSYERNIAQEQSARFTSVGAHVVTDGPQGGQLRWLVNLTDAVRPYGTLPQFRTANVRERAQRADMQGTWERQNPNGSHIALMAGYERGTYNPSATLPSGIAVDRALDGLIPEPAAAVTLGQSDVHLDFNMPALHSHTLRAGVRLARSTAAGHVLGTPSIAELLNGLPARVWITEAETPDSHRAVLSLAGYVEDRIAVSDRLSLDVGLRVGKSSGGADGSPQTVHWTAFLPRLNIRVALPVATVFGGLGRYQDDVPLTALAFGDPGAPVFDVYRWTDANGNGRFDPGEAGVLVARAGHGASVGSIDPALHAPNTNEVVIGAERTLGRGMLISLTGVYRREHSLLRSVNVGAPTSSYRLSFIPDPGEDYLDPADDRPLPVFDRVPSSFGKDRYVLTNNPAEMASYGGADLTWQLQGARWWSLVGATACWTWSLSSNPGFRSNENDPGLIGTVLENPNALTYARGSMFFDRSYVVKWSAAYRAPHRITVSAVARYNDGQPFSRLVVVPGLAQGPELISAYRAGRTRFQYSGSLDVRIEKGFNVGRHAAAVRFEAYNLPNMANEVEENAVYSPAFRQTTAVQPPRVVRLGFHMEF
jgi:hypothetical protein